MVTGLTQKDVELAEALLDKGGDGKNAIGEGDKGKQGADSEGKKSEAEGDKSGDKSEGDKGGKSEGEGKQAPPRRSILDDLEDDDDDAGEGDKGAKQGAEDDKGKDKGKDAEGDKAADGEGKDKQVASSEWRGALADRILKGQDDKLTAKQLETARGKILKDLARYKSADDYMAAGFAAQQKIRSGEYKTARPDEGATEAEVAQWRKANDIPEKWEEYELPKVDGYKFVEADQPVVDSFKQSAHEAHLDRKQVAILTKAHAKAIAAENARTEEQMALQDKDDSDQAADDLRNRYGVGEYKPRVRAMDRLLSDDELLPDQRGDRIRDARYYDPETRQWRKLINDPFFASLLMQHAEYEYGDVGFTPTADVTKSQSRIKELRELQSKDYNAYMTPGANGKSPADELLELEQKEEERQARRGGKRAA